MAFILPTLCFLYYFEIVLLWVVNCPLNNGENLVGSVNSAARSLTNLSLDT